MQMRLCSTIIVLLGVLHPVYCILGRLDGCVLLNQDDYMVQLFEKNGRDCYLISDTNGPPTADTKVKHVYTTLSTITDPHAGPVGQDVVFSQLSRYPHVCSWTNPFLIYSYSDVSKLINVFGVQSWSEEHRSGKTYLKLNVDFLLSSMISTGNGLFLNPEFDRMNLVYDSDFSSVPNNNRIDMVDATECYGKMYQILVESVHKLGGSSNLLDCHDPFFITKSRDIESFDMRNIYANRCITTHQPASGNNYYRHWDTTGLQVTDTENSQPISFNYASGAPADFETERITDCNVKFTWGGTDHQ